MSRPRVVTAGADAGLVPPGPAGRRPSPPTRAAAGAPETRRVAAPQPGTPPGRTAAHDRADASGRTGTSGRIRTSGRTETSTRTGTAAVPTRTAPPRKETEETHEHR
ncbi:hypothetical protein ACH4PW_03100 [Streptomyces sp. NPDC017082]|uniref:hypothetical protein n=1 Tax=Streptomyces sp. NPDC017082 TaxID=3364974 RepID=UPI00379AE804